MTGAGSDRALDGRVAWLQWIVNAYTPMFASLLTAGSTRHATDITLRTAQC
ncbi:hypothetical protein ACV229_07480 [Burkholderia sp. MR1-5-21]